MRVIGLLIFTLVLPAWTLAHPLHLSITNITYENGKLQISMKTFRDDWEVAYFHYHSKPIDFTDPSMRELPWFEGYLNKRFRISTGEAEAGLKLELVRIHMEEDAMTLEMQSDLPSKPNSLYIYNALLTDIYPDQTNLVIFGFKKRETGIKFDVRKQTAEVVLK
ncbi:MAG: DUF6702 family protein [Bacteroidota bacterium]